MIFLKIHYLSLKKCLSRKIIMWASLWAIIHRHCRMGNPTQTKMNVQLRSPLACMKMQLILVSPLTSKAFFGKCLSTGQNILWVKFLFIADGDDYCYEKHFLKGKLTNNANREHWRNLRINVFTHLIIDAINRKSVGACVLIIGVMPKKFFHQFLKWPC